MTTGDPSATPAAIDALVEHRQRFLGFVRKRVRDQDVAEEILQGAYAKALTHAEDIRDDERAVAWFYRVLRNAVIDHWRARATRLQAAAELERALASQPVPDPDTSSALCRCFEPLLPGLPADQARMLRRVDLEDARPVDVAAEEGITPNLAMVRLHRARKALRRRLEESCRVCAEHGCLDCTCRPAPRPA